MTKAYKPKFVARVAMLRHEHDKLRTPDALIVNLANRFLFLICSFLLKIISYIILIYIYLKKLIKYFTYISKCRFYNVIFFLYRTLI